MAEKVDIKMYAGSIAPTVTATPDATGVTITIIDADGIHTAHVNNGADGATGQTGPQGAPGPMGPQGTAGAPFRIVWIASSFEELVNDTTHGQVGEFAIISSTPEDPHNAELYVKVATPCITGYWSFVTDMSGASGIQGPQGPAGPQGNPGTPGSQGPQGVSVDDVGLMNDGRLFFHFDGPISGGHDYKYINPTYLPAVTMSDVGKKLVVKTDGAKAYWGIE